MKILVTGGTGFLGRHLVWRLAAQGMEVTFTGRDARAAQMILAQATKKVHWFALDHGQADALHLLQQATRGCDAVVHCAALSSPWGRPTAFHIANVASTQDVLSACHAQDVRRLVHISTPSLYFDFRDRYQIREDMVLPLPVNDYAKTKGQAEQWLRAHSQLDTVVLRPRAIFGPWDQTLLPRLLRAMSKGPLPLARKGRIELDLTYVSNVVDAIVLALTHPLKTPFSVYNVSNGEPVVLMDLLERIALQFDVPLRTIALPWPVLKPLAHVLAWRGKWQDVEPIITPYSAGVMAFGQTLCLDAIRKDLGYEPRVKLAEGIERHAQWWKEQT